MGISPPRGARRQRLAASFGLLSIAIILSFLRWLPHHAPGSWMTFLQGSKELHSHRILAEATSALNLPTERFSALEHIVQAFDSTATTSNNEGNCPHYSGVSGVDAQMLPSSLQISAQCAFSKCHVSHTAAGEWIEYGPFAIQNWQWESLTVALAVASVRPRRIQVEWRHYDPLLQTSSSMGSIIPEKDFTTQGRGWRSYEDIIIEWNKEDITFGEAFYILRVRFQEGLTNLCALEIRSEASPPQETSSPTSEYGTMETMEPTFGPTNIPTGEATFYPTSRPTNDPTIPPSNRDYDDKTTIPLPYVSNAVEGALVEAFDTTPFSNQGNCPIATLHGMDANKLPTDSLRQLCFGECHVAHTAPHEWIEYGPFDLVSTSIQISLWLSSVRPRPVRIEWRVSGQEIAHQQIVTARNGWRQYEEISVDLEASSSSSMMIGSSPTFVLRIVFEEGLTNLCKLAVESTGSTFAPVPTNLPTGQPTAFPTAVPTGTPTMNPTAAPTNSPTRIPTELPTHRPTRTFQPTNAPTHSPTWQPTRLPTFWPTIYPTTASPTMLPTKEPTLLPTNSPTGFPTAPTSLPTSEPTWMPTWKPTSLPTRMPTDIPTGMPTSHIFPTMAPTNRPTLDESWLILSSRTTTRVNALEAVAFFSDTSSNNEGNCATVSGPVDGHSLKTQALRELCMGPCHVSHTDENEYVEYKIAAPFSKNVDISLWVASVQARRLRLEVRASKESNEIPVESITLTTPAAGSWSAYSELRWKVDLPSAYSLLRVVFVDGKTNLCALELSSTETLAPTTSPAPTTSLAPSTPEPTAQPTFEIPIPVVPTWVNALDFSQASMVQTRDLPIDPWQNVCRGDQGIVLTDGGSLVDYSFYVGSSISRVDVTLMLASSGRRRVRFELHSKDNNSSGLGQWETQTPSLGNDKYRRIAWRGVDILSQGRYTLRMVAIDTGPIHLCALHVEEARPTPPETQSTRFYAIGDAPYNGGQEDELRQQLRDLPRDGSKFVIHVGDIQGGGGNCEARRHERIRDILRNSFPPMLLIVGDNEWNDCRNHQDALQIWRGVFSDLTDQYWPNNDLNLQSMSGRPETFAFVQNRVLWMGLNIVGGTVRDEREWESRFDMQNEWVEEQVTHHFLEAGDIDTLVIFGHAAPREAHEHFFTRFQSRTVDRYPDMSVLYLNGDGHHWRLDRSYRGRPNWLRIQIVGGTKELPLQVTVHSGKEGNAGQAFVHRRTY